MTTQTAMRLLFGVSGRCFRASFFVLILLPSSRRPAVPQSCRPGHILLTRE